MTSAEAYRAASPFIRDVASGPAEAAFGNCMSGVRAEPFAYGAQELAELELYLAARAEGMTLEASACAPEPGKRSRTLLNQ